MKFPILYKKTNLGATQFWEIWTEERVTGAGVIITKYGQLDTESPQITTDVVTQGKNSRRANRTTPLEQADAEAQSKWEKKKKTGYVETIEAAQAGQVDSVIEGGVVPMLAFTFEKQGHKIKYPAFVQKKYDGTRMIAILKNGTCTLWSRTRKPITSLPHIIAEIEERFVDDIILDGEAYNHKFKNNFEHIIHLVRQETPDKDHKDVEFHVYDTINGDPFNKRTALLQNAFTVGKPKFKHLVLADTLLVQNEAEAIDAFNRFKEEGYEGAILRNSSGLYVHKRSADLIKIKEFDDAEFKVIGVEEGRGKLSGHVGAFVCITETGMEFKAKMSGDTEKLKEYFRKPNACIGKMLTVKYQGLTGANNVPRFPIGMRFRKDE